MSENDAQLSGETAQPDFTRKRTKQRIKAWQVFVIIFGIVIPAIAIIFEMALRPCASLIFDPIPSVLHFILLAATVVANVIVLRAYRRGDSRFPALAAILIGVAIGVSFGYSLVFLSILPLSVIALIIGIGIFGLSPYFTLSSAIICARRLGELELIDHQRYKKLLWTGIISSFMLLALSTASSFITDYGLKMATSTNDETSIRGVKLIRTLGSDNALLRRCYGLSAGMWWPNWTWVFGINEEPVSADEARLVYYKVTGDSFNATDPPRLLGRRSRMIEDFEFDPDIGGTAVNSKVLNLSMTTSMMDGRVNPDELTAYTEWTMVFKNSAIGDREARAEIALPPGGVVSRLTLWVNGEEREAAFSSRGKVREAYQQVAIVQQRDPVLVTTCGPDRVLMQCFPVPANGGTMKIRIGITSPLMPDGYSKGMLVLPRFIERNFEVNDIEHSLLIESPKNMGFENDGENAKIIKSFVSDSELAGAKSAIYCQRDDKVRRMWTPDRLEPEKFAVVQTLAESDTPAPKNIIVVIDGSKRLKDFASDIADAIANLPEKCRFSILVAGDDVTELAGMKQGEPGVLSAVQKRIRNIRFAGGMDNSRSLLDACDAALSNENTAIVWVHGPQPFPSAKYMEHLNQLWVRHPSSIELFAVEAAGGRNSILADLEKTGAVTVVPRVGTLTDDLKRLFDGWNDGTKKQLVATRGRVPLNAVMDGVRASSHVARLWARDEVIRMCRKGDSRKLPEVADFAGKYEIVTSLSGAVVLETKEQYDQAGLKAVDPSKVPTTSVPEPAGLMVLASGALIALAQHRKKKGSQKS